MLNGVPGGDPLTFSIAVVAAVSAGLLVYRDADKHGHYHALSASAAVGIAALVGFFVANLVGLAVATGYVLLLYLLSYPSTPGIDGEEERRTPDRPDGSPQGDAGENITGADDVVSVIRIEIANEDTLRELAGRYDDVPEDAPVGKLRSMLRVKALGTVLDEAETDDEFSLRDWAEADETASVDDWYGESPSGDSERPSSGAAAWNAAPSGDEADEDDDETESGSIEEWSAETSAEAETGSIEEWDIDAEATESGTPDESSPDTDERANGSVEGRDTVGDEEAETGGIEGWTTEAGREDTDHANSPDDGSESDPASRSVTDGDQSSATAENEPPSTGAGTSSEDAENEDEDDGFGWAEVEAE